MVVVYEKFDLEFDAVYKEYIDDAIRLFDVLVDTKMCPIYDKENNEYIYHMYALQEDYQEFIEFLDNNKDIRVGIME